MILGPEQAKKELSHIEKNIYDYKIIDARKIFFNGEKEDFDKALKALNCLSSIHVANKLYADCGSSNRINSDIVLKAVDSSVSRKPFSDEDLLEYYMTMQHFERFIILTKFLTTMDAYVTYEMEFLLFGLEYEEYYNLEEQQLIELERTYGDLYCDLRYEKMTPEEFIPRVKELSEKARKDEL